MSETQGRSRSCFGRLPARTTSSVKRVPKEVKKRVTPKARIQALRDEITALNRRMRMLNESHLLRQSLDRLLNEQTTDSENWKKCATRERYARKHAEESKTKLVRQIEANTRMLEGVKQTVFTLQVKSATLLVPAQLLSAAPDRHDVQLFVALKSRLDFRQNKLDAILQQCDVAVDTIEKKVSSVRSGGRCFDVHDFLVKAFDGRAIVNAIHRYFEEESHFRWHAANEVGTLKVSSSPSVISAAGGVLKQIEYQSLLVMLWETETVTDWENDHHQEADKPTRIQLWQNGWTVVRPLGGLDSGVSVIQSGTSTHFCGPNESALPVLDPHTMSIIQSLAAYGAQRIENMLMNAAVKYRI